MTSEDFAVSVERLLKQIGHWEQSRWSATAHSPAAPSSAAQSPADSSAAQSPADSSAAHLPVGRSPSGSSGGGESSRADVVYHLAQQLADLGADAEGRPRRPVPRVGHLTLPDQVKVMADDLFAAGVSDDVFKLATEEVDAARRVL